VVRDAMMEPVRKVQSATHFKRVCVLHDNHLCLLFNRVDDGFGGGDVVFFSIMNL